jgi:hypothetical protein
MDVGKEDRREFELPHPWSRLQPVAFYFRPYQHPSVLLELVFVHEDDIHIECNRRDRTHEERPQRMVGIKIWSNPRVNGQRTQILSHPMVLNIIIHITA